MVDEKPDRSLGASHIRGYDTLRAISILMVLITHLGLKKWLSGSSEFVTKQVWQLISGATGVRVFFTLSGFLITRILLIELKNTGKVAIGNFYARRFIRLVPPLLVFYSLVGILMYQGLLPPRPKAVLISALYLYNFTPGKFYTGELGHTWSLAIEEQFYVIWPLLVGRFTKFRMLHVIGTGLVLCLVSMAIYRETGVGGSFFPARWFFPAVGPILVGSGFAISLVLKPDFWERAIGNRWALLLGFVFFLCPVYMPAAITEAAMPLLQAAGVSLTLVWVLMNQTSRFVSLLEVKPFPYLGKISYGLYVYQGLFLRTGPGGGTLWVQQFPQNAVLTVLCAVCSWHFLEKPVLRLKSKFRH